MWRGTGSGPGGSDRRRGLRVRGRPGNDRRGSPSPSRADRQVHSAATAFHPRRIRGVRRGADIRAVRSGEASDPTDRRAAAYVSKELAGYVSKQKTDALRSKTATRRRPLRCSRGWGLSMAEAGSWWCRRGSAKRPRPLIPGRGCCCSSVRMGPSRCSTDGPRFRATPSVRQRNGRSGALAERGPWSVEDRQLPFGQAELLRSCQSASP
jgi:hypothetical protein